MGRFIRAFVSVTVVIVALAQATAFATPRNVLLARGRTEPVVAVDPRDPSTVVAGSNTNYDAPVGDTLPVGFFASHDGGRSFVAGTAPILRPFTTGADPTVQFGTDGTLYYTYLGETANYCSSGRSAVLLVTSRDAGRTFDTPSVVDADPADDKPDMAVEDGSHGSAHIFVVWTRWHNRGSDIWYARSTDGGRHFGRPSMLYSSLLDNFGPVPAVGPHGRVYVFWAVFPEDPSSTPSKTVIYMRASSDDGARFDPVRQVAGPFYGVPRMAQPGSLRNLTMPAVAIGRSGKIYLAWSAAVRQHPDKSVDADILMKWSRNEGATWSQAIRVNDARTMDRFMPAISVLPDGSAGLVFYDRRASPWQMDVYAARVSFRGGVRVSRNVRVTAASSSISDIYYLAPGSTCFSPGRFFGDYIGSSACGDGTLCVVWADAQLRVQDETEVWFARVPLP